MTLKETLKKHFTIVLWFRNILIFIIIILSLRWAIAEGVRLGTREIVSKLSYIGYDKRDRLTAVLKATASKSR